MATIRFRSRHLHATFVQKIRTEFTTLGWITPPINFGTHPVTLIDYQPDERGSQINQNTVAVSLGDYGVDEEEELGAYNGGLMSALYPVFVDVYMAEQALSYAICDDIRDTFENISLDLVNQIDSTVVPNTRIEVEGVNGPDRPPAQVGAEQFKRYWRAMRIDARLYYPG